jgi:hypothetical protein
LIRPEQRQAAQLLKPKKPALFPGFSKRRKRSLRSRAEVHAEAPRKTR